MEKCLHRVGLDGPVLSVVTSCGLQEDVIDAYLPYTRLPGNTH